jgi:D-3-phosphoglycerate dehydrogenase
MTILMLETIDEGAMALLRAAGPVIVSPSPNAHENDLPFEEVTAIVTRGLGQLDRALIEKCPNLKVIARCGAGLNNLDLQAAAENEIQVIFAPGINAAAVAEHTLMLMLMTVRNGFSTGAEVKKGNWACRDEFCGDDLRGKKICIVGGGEIGGRTADLCGAFGMDVVVCGRQGNGIEGLKSMLNAHLQTSDIISLHIPLTAETMHIVSRDLLALFKKGSTLINTARGELVRERDVVDALDSGRLEAYAADVVEGDTSNLSPIVSHPRSVVTPHVAAMTKRTYCEMSLFTAKNVLAALNGGHPNPVSVYRGAVS